MTTSVKIKSANYPVLVTTSGKDASGVFKTSSTRVLIPDDGEVQFYCSTGMSIHAVDIEYDDERVPEHYRKKA